MEDVKKHVAALFNSRFSKRYLPRNKRPPFKGVISLDFLDRVLEDDLQENEYIPLNILEKPIVLSPDAKKNKDGYVSPDISDHISLDILDRIIYSQNYSSREKKNDNHIPLDILDVFHQKTDKTKDERYISLDILDKKLRKEKCEHLSPVMDCFAGGFGHIRCFDQDFHENCSFKLNHKKMLEERMQIRKDMKKF